MFASYEPAIATIAQRQGDTVARAAVVYLLADALDFFNATETMSDTQVATTVDLIMEDYPYLKTDDLKLCFKNAMKGRYGKLYNRIDGQIIMGWLHEYDKERCNRADELSWNEHKAHICEEQKETSGLFYQEYRESLEACASEGDQSAINALELSDSIVAKFTELKFGKQKKELEEFYAKIEKEK